MGSLSWATWKWLCRWVMVSCLIQALFFGSAWYVEQKDTPPPERTVWVTPWSVFEHQGVLYVDTESAEPRGPQATACVEVTRQEGMALWNHPKAVADWSACVEKGNYSRSDASRDIGEWTPHDDDWRIGRYGVGDAPAPPGHPVVREPLSPFHMTLVCDYIMREKHPYGSKGYWHEIRSARCEGREIT